MLHIRVEPLLLVCGSVFFTLEGASTYLGFIWLFAEIHTLTEQLRNTRFLELLLETLLQAVIGFIAVLFRKNCHVRKNIGKLATKCK